MKEVKLKENLKKKAYSRGLFISGQRIKKTDEKLNDKQIITEELSRKYGT